MKVAPFLQIKTFLNKAFFVAENDISPLQNFAALGFSSVEFNDLILRLEMIYQININDKELKKVFTIQDLTTLVVKKSQ